MVKKNATNLTQKSLFNIHDTNGKIVELGVNSEKKKNDQIIVRLPLEVKEQLQIIATELDVDMSKMIRDKIDEIIAEYKFKKENKRVYDSKDEFIKSKNLTDDNLIIDSNLIAELKEEFKKRFVEKMQKEIDETDIMKSFIDEEK